MIKYYGIIVLLWLIPQIVFADGADGLLVVFLGGIALVFLLLAIVCSFSYKIREDTKLKVICRILFVCNVFLIELLTLIMILGQTIVPLFFSLCILAILYFLFYRFIMRSIGNQVLNNLYYLLLFMVLIIGPYWGKFIP